MKLLESGALGGIVLNETTIPAKQDVVGEGREGQDCLVVRSAVECASNGA